RTRCARRLPASDHDHRDQERDRVQATVPQPNLPMLVDAPCMILASPYRTPPSRPRGGQPMRTTFVTGGSGFVGRNLIRALRARGDDVRALARSDAAASVVVALGAQAVRGDLDDVDV